MSKLILHLDDEPAIRELLAARLAMEGFRVISVASPAEAYQAAGQQQPDLFITDLQLDDGDGLDAIRQLRETLPNIPVLVLTGVLIDSRAAQQSLTSKAASYLSKTTPLAKVMEEVRRLAGPA